MRAKRFVETRVNCHASEAVLAMLRAALLASACDRSTKSRQGTTAWRPKAAGPYFCGVTDFKVFEEDLMALQESRRTVHPFGCRTLGSTRRVRTELICKSQAAKLRAGLKGNSR